MIQFVLTVLLTYLNISLNLKFILPLGVAKMKKRAHIKFTGTVQGVGFRYFVFRRAESLGLSGSVKNLLSGEVEIEIQGDRSLIEEFLKQVQAGPRSAEVNNLKIDWQPCSNFISGFEIR